MHHCNTTHSVSSNPYFQEQETFKKVQTSSSEAFQVAFLQNPISSFSCFWVTFVSFENDACFYFSRRRSFEEKQGKDIELKNLQLYLENQTIIEENEKLREKANILHQENLALMTEFHKKFPHFDQRK